MIGTIRLIIVTEGTNEIGVMKAIGGLIGSVVGVGLAPVYAECRPGDGAGAGVCVVW